MSILEEKLKEKLKPVSSVKGSGIIVQTVHASSLVALNKSIDKKIRQNEEERKASMAVAAKCIVGGKV